MLYVPVSLVLRVAVLGDAHARVLSLCLMSLSLSLPLTHINTRKHLDINAFMHAKISHTSLRLCVYFVCVRARA